MTAVVNEGASVAFLWWWRSLSPVTSVIAEEFVA